MSTDTMPCGCEGHADNAALCRYPARVERVRELESALRRASEELRAERPLIARVILVAVLEPKT